MKIKGKEKKRCAKGVRAGGESRLCSNSAKTAHDIMGGCQSYSEKQINKIEQRQVRRAENSRKGEMDITRANQGSKSEKQIDKIEQDR